MEQNALCNLLNISFPIIMAPMFLVSNESMVIEASKSGIAGAIPALNYRTTQEFQEGLIRLKNHVQGAFGVNLIVNKSNFFFEEQLRLCLAYQPDFIITSLGSPEKTIQLAHAKGIKVFCDVVDLDYALKVEKMGADALIAVNNQAGGHAGNIPQAELITLLKSNCSIPVISAGGVGDAAGVASTLAMGADGLSIGTVFIATTECGVSQEYKDALVHYDAKDIVMTKKLSGTNCTVINTPYVQKIGTEQTFLERMLSKNKRLKKWVKAFVFYRGMKALKKAAFSANYKTVWCAGPSIAHIKEIRSVKEVASELSSAL